MRYLAIICLVIAATSSASALACDESDLSAAQSLKDALSGQVQLGTASPLDEMEAEKFLLDTQFCLTKISKDEYCAGAKPLQTKIVEATQKKARLGAATAKEQVDALKEMSTLTGVCK